MTTQDGGTAVREVLEAGVPRICGQALGPVGQARSAKTGAERAFVSGLDDMQRALPGVDDYVRTSTTQLHIAEGADAAGALNDGAELAGLTQKPSRRTTRTP